METDKGFLIKMKIIVNVIASIVFIVQFISFFIIVLNQKAPESTMESLYYYFVLTASLCSICTIAIFGVIYNFNFKTLHKKKTNYIFLVITILGLYIPILQIYLLNDFVLASCVLLILVSYNMLKIMKNLVPKSDEN